MSHISDTGLEAGGQGTGAAGSALLGFILAMVVIGGLGVGVVSMHGTSSLHEVRADYGEQAFYMAESGFRYAYAVYNSKSTKEEGIKALLALNGTEVDVPGDGKFSFPRILVLNSTQAQETLFTVDGDQHIASGDDLQINPPDAQIKLWQYNGVFAMDFSNGDGTSTTHQFRYLEYDQDASVLKNIIDLKKQSDPFLQTQARTFPDGTNGTSLELARIESKGEYPGYGDLNAARTVTYFWPLPEVLHVPDPPDREKFDSPYLLDSPNEHLTLENHNYAQGSIFGQGVNLDNHAEVTGNVISNGTVTLDNHAQVEGKICANGDVELRNHAYVGQDIFSNGTVTLGSNDSLVQGSVYAAGNVTLNNGAQVPEDIHAGGNIFLGHKAEVNGTLYASDNVEMTSSDVLVHGDVNTSGDVIFGWKGTVLGNVVASGSVLATNGKNTIGGNATAGRKIQRKDRHEHELIDIIGKPNVGNPNPEPPVTPHVCTGNTLPKHANCTAQGQDVVVNWGESVEISAKDTNSTQYGQLILDGQNVVKLAPGNYYFSSITSGWHVDLYLDLSAPGNFYNIFVAGDVNWGGQLDIYVKYDGTYEPIVPGPGHHGEHEWESEGGSNEHAHGRGNDEEHECGNGHGKGHAYAYGHWNDAIDEELMDLASRCYLETLGSFTMGNHSEWFGTVYAKGDITFDNQNTVIGSFHSSDGKITTANQLDAYYVPYDVSSIVHNQDVVAPILN